MDGVQKTLDTDLKNKSGCRYYCQQMDIASDIVFLEICNVSGLAKFGGRLGNVFTSLSTVLLPP